MGVADEFRNAMDEVPKPLGYGVEAGVSVFPWLPCTCGCGRPGGVAILTPVGTFLLRDADEVKAMTRALAISARALGWEVPGG